MIMFKSLKNNGGSSYVEPVGMEFQKENFGDSVSLHTDAFVITRLNDLKMSKAMQDVILSRFTSIQDSLPSDLSDSISKLSDSQAMDLVDSRYQQTLSDRSDKLKSLMSSIDKFVKDSKDSDLNNKYQMVNDALYKRYSSLLGLDDDK